MTDECVFCRIISHDAAGRIVYEDGLTVAFVDRRQVTPGHTLVVPRRHVRDIFELDGATGAALMLTTVRIAAAVRDAFGCEGISTWQQNGASAGQEVFHMHVHVMPRHAGDGLLRIYAAPPSMPDGEELDAMARSIRAALG